MTALRFDRVSVRFGAHEVLRDISFSVQPQTVHFVMGVSGAGKSVLIKQVVGLLRPTSGSIFVGAQNITHLSEAAFFGIRSTCALIFQQATLIDSLTVLQNVALPLRKRLGLRKDQAHDEARRALRQVDAEDLATRMPPTLSMGLKKRIAIARALALKPTMILFDEPTSSLDPINARRIDRLIANTPLTRVVVSHDLAALRAIGHRVTFLHEGSVHFEGPAEEFLQSTDPILKAFTA